MDVNPQICHLTKYIYILAGLTFFKSCGLNDPMFSMALCYTPTSVFKVHLELIVNGCEPFYNRQSQILSYYKKAVHHATALQIMQAAHTYAIHLLQSGKILLAFSVKLLHLESGISKAVSICESITPTWSNNVILKAARYSCNRIHKTVNQRQTWTVDMETFDARSGWLPR